MPGSHYSSLKNKRMKTNLIWSILIVTSIILSSCEPTDVNTNFKNYWSSNTLVRMQLRAKVKSVETNDVKYEFNEKGFITKSTYATEAGNSVQIYNYGSSGELSTLVSTYGSNTSTTTYMYENHGKYVVNSTFHLHETGLTPNLKAIIGENSRTDYVFSGNNLLVISTYGSTKDTAIVKYDGKYPVSSITSWSFIKDMEFASNGMFLKYSEGFTGSNYNDTRTYTFEKNDEYLILKNIKYEYLNENNLETRTTTYTYNENKDVLTESTDESIQEYYDYVYDDNNNWTSRKYKYKSGSQSEWSNPQTETRTFVYWK